MSLLALLVSVESLKKIHGQEFCNFFLLEKSTVYQEKNNFILASAMHLAVRLGKVGFGYFFRFRVKLQNNCSPPVSHIVQFWIGCIPYLTLILGNFFNLTIFRKVSLDV